jgi:dTDP-glucose pyrophosphorylase/transcriptional regulator with XRE-family HTH domain
MAKNLELFGSKLQKQREAVGLSLQKLGKRAGLNPSQISRIETGNRRPSFEQVVRLARVLDLPLEELGQIFETSTESTSSTDVRVRGAIRQPQPRLTDTTNFATQLSAIGFQEASLNGLLQAWEHAPHDLRDRTTNFLSETLSRLTQKLQAPIRKAVIPLIGREWGMVSHHLMKSLLQRLIEEATDCGIHDFVIVLTADIADSVVPLLKGVSFAHHLGGLVSVDYCIQSDPKGLGHALLIAEELVNAEPFAVLLPDDILTDRQEHSSGIVFGSMMKAYQRFNEANVIAVAELPKERLSQCEVVEVEAPPVDNSIYRVLNLVEKTNSEPAISQQTIRLGIVGRYLLNPGIFPALREIQSDKDDPFKLTHALNHLRNTTEQSIYAFLLTAPSADVGEVLKEMRESLERILK